jgi:hypothetical protein
MYGGVQKYNMLILMVELINEACAIIGDHPGFKLSTLHVHLIVPIATMKAIDLIGSINGGRFVKIHLHVGSTMKPPAQLRINVLPDDTDRIQVFNLPACTMLPTKVPDHKSFPHKAAQIIEGEMGKSFVPPYKDPLHMRPFKVVSKIYMEMLNDQVDQDSIHFANGSITQVVFSQMLDSVILVTFNMG